MEWKEKGNKAFQEGKYMEAREAYSKGIIADGSLAVLYSNRAAAAFALKDFEAALSDALAAISLLPSFVKAHMRKAEALMSLSRYAEAMVSFEEALMLEADNAEVRKALVACRTRYTEIFFVPLVAQKPIRVQFISLERGRGVFAAKQFKLGNLLYQEEPLSSLLAVNSAPKGVKVCSYTMRTVLNPYTMPKPWNTLMLEHYKVGAPKMIDCPHCKGNGGYCEQYMSEEYRAKAWSEYHEILCTGSKGKDHPLSKLVEKLRELKRSNPLFIIRMMAHIVRRLTQENKRLLETNATRLSSLQGEELTKAHRDLRNRARLWAFEPFAMFVSNEEVSSVEEEAVETLRTILGSSEFDDVVAVATFRSLHGAILRNVQALNPVSDLHLALSSLPAGKQVNMVKEYDPSIDSPMGFLEHPFMKNLCVEGSGLFLLANSTNHSCEPNIISASTTNDHRVSMFALRDIKTGEELTISYVDEKQPFATRQRILKEMYFFECKCPKCLRKE